MSLVKWIPAFSVLLFCCGKTDPTVQPPPDPPRLDCVADHIASYNNSPDYMQTSYSYSSQRKLESSRNAFTTCKFHYKDTLIVKREVLYTSSGLLRNYDSLFYHSDGSLAQVKMFTFDDTKKEFVNDIILQFQYTGKQLTGLDYTFEKNDNMVTNHYEYTWDAKQNIVKNTVRTYDGSVGIASYYYRDTVNKLAQLRVPIGLFLTNTGLAKPELLPGDLPMFLSAKAMNRYDDWSGNTGVKVDMNAVLSSITVKINDLLIYTFSLSCQ
ncbi:MAG: hypothetical protein ACTHMC_05790 [Pseudobacter sp.]|uniref:hypothetical protein n=1 Tax=Pseudobacter sp. TaxID=2045420 RepID=UPI003F7DD4DD